MSKILQVDTKGGDVGKQFSPFNCRVEAFGVVRSIEDHYQMTKRFRDTFTGTVVSAANWKHAKALQANAEYKRIGFYLPNGLSLGSNNDAVTDLVIQWYISLWYKFYRTPEGQLLVPILQEYDEFVDIFAGKFPFSQARVALQVSKENLESLKPMFKELLVKIKEYASQQ